MCQRWRGGCQLIMEDIAHVHVAQQSRYWNAGVSETVGRVVPGMRDSEARQLLVPRIMTEQYRSIPPRRPDPQAPDGGAHGVMSRLCGLSRGRDKTLESRAGSHWLSTRRHVSCLRQLSGPSWRPHLMSTTTTPPPPPPPSAVLPPPSQLAPKAHRLFVRDSWTASLRHRAEHATSTSFFIINN